MLKEQSDLTQQWSYTVVSHSLRPAVAMVTHWHALRNHGPTYMKVIGITLQQHMDSCHWKNSRPKLSRWLTRMPQTTMLRLRKRWKSRTASFYQRSRTCSSTDFAFNLSEHRHCTVVSHSEHRFPAPSSKLCHNWLRHWKGILAQRRCQHPLKGLDSILLIRLWQQHSVKART